MQAIRDLINPNGDAGTVGTTEIITAVIVAFCAAHIGVMNAFPTAMRLNLHNVSYANESMGWSVCYVANFLGAIPGAFPMPFLMRRLYLPWVYRICMAIACIGWLFVIPVVARQVVDWENGGGLALITCGRVVGGFAQGMATLVAGPGLLQSLPGELSCRWGLVLQAGVEAGIMLATILAVVASRAAYSVSMAGLAVCAVGLGISLWIRVDPEQAKVVRDLANERVCDQPPSGGPPYWRDMFVLIFLAVVQQLSGINLNITGQTEIVLGVDWPEGLFGLLGALLQFLSFWFLFWVILRLRWPRRRKTCWGVASAVTALGAFIYGVGRWPPGKDWLQILGNFLLMLGFGAGPGPLTWLIGSELVECRFFKMSVMAAVNFALSFTVVLVWEKVAGPPFVWLVSGGCMAIAACGAWFIPDDPQSEEPGLPAGGIPGGK